MKLLERIGNILNNDMTVTELSNKSGIPKSVISNFRSGKRLPKNMTVETADKLLSVEQSIIIYVIEYKENKGQIQVHYSGDEFFTDIKKLEDQLEEEGYTYNQYDDEWQKGSISAVIKELSEG